MDDYWKQVRKRAWLETKHLLGFGSPMRIAIQSLVIVAAFGGLYFFGSPDAARDEIVMRMMMGVVFFALIIPVVFLWNSAAAIPKMALETKNALQAQIDTMAADIRSLREDAQPRLRFGCIIHEFPDRNPNIAEFIYSRWLIEITNTGTDFLSRCVAKLVAVRRKDLTGAQVFQAAIPTKAREADGVWTRFNLGPGETKLLVVLCLSYRSSWKNENDRVFIQTEHTRVKLEDGVTCEIDLTAIGEKGQPTNVTLIVEFDEDGVPSLTRSASIGEGTAAVPASQ